MERLSYGMHDLITLACLKTEIYFATNKKVICLVEQANHKLYSEKQVIMN